jgi:hypothetical protein
MVELLEDRIVPDLGLDETGRRAFDFGPRQFYTATTYSTKLKRLINKQGFVWQVARRAKRHGGIGPLASNLNPGLADGLTQSGCNQIQVLSRSTIQSFLERERLCLRLRCSRSLCKCRD